MEKEIAGKKVEVDSEGYLIKMTDWIRDMADVLAAEEGITNLSDKHWQVIDFIRKDTKENGQSPSIRRITKLSGISTKELYELFPEGPGKKSSRIAGVPKPVSCV